MLPDEHVAKLGNGLLGVAQHSTVSAGGGDASYTTLKMRNDRPDHRRPGRDGAADLGGGQHPAGDRIRDCDQ